MSINRDCGDLTVAVVIRTGAKYLAAAVTDVEKLTRLAIDEKIAEIIPKLEKTILDQICDHIGFDAETVTAKVKARDEKLAADRKAEDEGRAEKKARRDGLPALQPAPKEGASEKEDNTAE